MRVVGSRKVALGLALVVAALAIGVACLGSFSLIGAGLLNGADTYYLSIRWMPHASVIGGLMFGYGMALAGNCGYGAIARLGGGDLRSFVIVLVMGGQQDIARYHLGD